MLEIIAFFAGVTLLALGITLYFLPTVIASKRGATSTMSIFWINFLLGWTLLGWIAVLIWGCTDKNEVDR